MSTCHSWMQDLEEEEDDDGGLFYHHPHNLSRLSVCTTSSSMCGVDDDAMMMSRLSIEDYEDDGDEADGELSGGEEEGLSLSSASEKEDFPSSIGSSCCCSLPNTPPAARRRKNKVFGVKEKEKEYASDNGPGDRDGVVLITRPKGGNKTLCMGLEEVKACRELGFELELPPSLETSSSGANSPIANWRISSPGDDPREVKARLKVWAQAVALASASKYAT
ncbi:hypothetical protein HN51_014813 [Arachis hypogaea]|uniref:Fold protein n=2 Tax=Arachis TaxID=3817 RepID=A0A445CMY5_ARAHY|nr:uncharacterized protein LOC107492313 [Arachis duranensis]XP_025603864.1 uncharacterized protein LOC112695651 [Arachis hypogaea]QHO45175.1 uncharacterized protein DS421_6g176820 [Arachis hypogaea]RYR52287.1 hypothetical protein Ahy_A06g027220 [Arachis hypogaea]